LWELYDGGVISWLVTDLSENDAKQRAADRNVIFNQRGQRDEDERREVKPPVPVESALWTAAGELDYWVRERAEWWGRVSCPDGDFVWIRSAELRPAKEGDTGG
jgi:hypothetical protein